MSVLDNINEQKLNIAIFEYLKENLTLDTEGDYNGGKTLQLKLQNPETGVYETIGYNWIQLKEGESDTYW